jgi:hypothetical protein
MGLNKGYHFYAMKHSGLGIASFCVSLFCGLLAVMLVAVSGFLVASGQNEESIGLILAGLGIIGDILLMLIALGLGIAGACMKDRRKIFAILGIIFSSLGLVCIGGLMVLGTIAE